MPCELLGKEDAWHKSYALAGKNPGKERGTGTVRESLKAAWVRSG